MDIEMIALFTLSFIAVSILSYGLGHMEGRDKGIQDGHKMRGDIHGK
jgi:hypothetical protein